MRIFVFAGALFVLLMAEVMDISGLKYQDLKLDSNLSCPIKHVPLSKNVDFAGIIAYKDGTYEAISSPKYTFRFLYTESMKNYDGVYKVYLTDYKTKQFIDATDAYYVFGSKIMSVGGDDVIPFAKESDAQEFLEKNSGKKIYRHDRIDKKFIEFLDLR